METTIVTNIRTKNPTALAVGVCQRTNTYRSVYTTKIGEKIYVLHAFQKKSKKGIQTPKKEIDLIKRRLKTAQDLAKGM